MQMNGKEIKETISAMTDAMIKEKGPEYTLGYMESFLSSLLTAYVPANQWHRMLETIKYHRDTFNEGI